MSSLTPVTISYQPSMYWALPIYLADTLGYFHELGLDASFVEYPSGGPQVAAAVENQAWDVGAAGVVPNILGWSKSPGLQTIGISNDESATNALGANHVGVSLWEQILQEKSLLNLNITTEDGGDNNNSTSTSTTTNIKMIITPNSTGQFAVEECLQHYGIEYDPEINFCYTPSQAAVMGGLSEQQLNVANFGSLWAPNTYSFVEKNEGAEIICNGTTANAPVPGGIMVRKQFGEDHPELVAKILAAWLRGITYMTDLNYRKETIEYMRKFYTFPISDDAIDIEFSRPLYNLQGQLDIMEKKKNISDEYDEYDDDDDDMLSNLGTWFQASVDFMMKQGTLKESPQPNIDAYINDKYMKMVADDDYLRDYASRPGPREVDMNHLTRIRPAGLTFAGLVMAGSIACAVWSYTMRDHRVVKASQPLFLFMICAGTFITASSIIPLSIDDSIADGKGLNAACMSFPWLLSIGFTTTFSALFSKIWRVNKLYKNASGFRRVKVTEMDVLLPFAILMTLNMILLISWTVIDPMVWHRTVPDTAYESYGYCFPQGSEWKIFLALILTINVFALALANLQAWKARNISTEFSESSFVMLTMASLLQACLIGIPLLVLVHSNATARYFVWSVLIFVVTSTVLLIMFVPKMRRVVMNQDLNLGTSERSNFMSYEYNTSRRSSNSPRRSSYSNGCDFQNSVRGSAPPTPHVSYTSRTVALSNNEVDLAVSSLENYFKRKVRKLKELLENDGGVDDVDALFQNAELSSLLRDDGTDKDVVDTTAVNQEEQKKQQNNEIEAGDEQQRDNDAVGGAPTSSETVWVSSIRSDPKIHRSSAVSFASDVEVAA